MTTEQKLENLKSLAEMDAVVLEALLETSPAPKLEDILGWEWKGYNHPWYCSLLGIRKFIKFFFGEPGAAEGCNIPAVQNGIDGEWRHKPSADAPKRFGFYTLGPAKPGENLYPNALLLDYGASPRNFALAPERLLRDYLVQVPNHPDLLLGKAYLALGGRVHVSYFILERLRKNPWRP